MSRTVARPYARAVFEFAVSESRLERWEHLLAGLATALERPEIKWILSHPRASAEDRLEVLELALARRLEITERNFLKLLIVHQRWNEVCDIAALYSEMRRTAASETECQVTTALTIDETAQTRWRVEFEKRLGRRVHLVFHIDPMLIGGARIRIGDRVWDGTVRGRLDLLSRALTRPLQYSRGRLHE